MSTRLDQLQALLQRQPDDTFLLYGIAMEYKKANKPAEALSMLQKVSELDPGHGYAWYQRGQILETTGDLAGARTAYQQGISAANQSSDLHARSELESALTLLLNQ